MRHAHHRVEVKKVIFMENKQAAVLPEKQTVRRICWTRPCEETKQTNTKTVGNNESKMIQIAEQHQQ